MFTRISRSGGRAYLQLVESYRNEAGSPRQRVVANLGRLDRLSDKDLDPLIGGLQRALGRQPSAASGGPEFESAKAFGDLFALQGLWEELGLSRALKRGLRASRRHFDVEALVRAMVFNRLCDPASKLGVLRWLDTVAMPHMPATVSHDQLLRTMDTLMDQVGAVEATVAGQIRPLLDETLSVVFYDLTTIRSHGEGQVANDLRAYGLNKRTGGIARQFVLGVVQTAEGLPIAHQVHAGNVGEVSTLLPMIEKTVQRFPIKRVVLIADRGLLSLDNLEAIEQLQTAKGQRLEYILAVPARRYGEFADTVAATKMKDDVGETTWQSRRLIVAHDPVRAEAQNTARRQTLAKIEDEGERLAKRLNDEDAGRPQRGRKSTDRRAYVRFTQMVKDASLSRILKADLTAERFNFDRDEDALRGAEQLDGKLLLVTNTDFKPADVIRRYKSLADIERGFRVLKSDLDIAPVHHRLPDRIRAHALICFLALFLYRVMRMRLRASNSTASPRRALTLLRQIQQHRVVIDSTTYSGTSRLVPEQRDLFEALNLPKPPTKTPA